MDVERKIKSTARHFLSNNRVAAEVVAQTAGLFTEVTRRTNVAMFHNGRCGSTVVGMLLNQHPKIRWIGEIFASLKRKYGEDSWVWEDPIRMINLRTKIHTSKVLGLEIKKKHLRDVNMDMSRLVYKLEKMGYEKYVSLERKNYLKREISKIVGNKMEKWNYKKEVEPPKVRVPVDYGKGRNIAEKFREVEKFYKKVKEKIGKEKLIVITYEDHVKSSPKKAFEKIVSDLGLKKTSTIIKTKKINEGPVRERVKNFEEIRDSLSGTKYEWMLSE